MGAARAGGFGGEAHRRSRAQRVATSRPSHADAGRGKRENREALLEEAAESLVEGGADRARASRGGDAEGGYDDDDDRDARAPRGRVDANRASVRGTSRPSFRTGA